MNTAIVTDSTADLPPTWLARYAIHTVSALVVLEGRSLRDGVDLSREEFYRRLPDLDPPPTTASPSSGEFEALYGELLARGAQHVVSIHLSARLSGIYNAARLAAQAFEGRVSVVDSGSLTMGLGFQVVEAAAAARRGAPVQAILDLLEELRPRTRVLALLDTMEYLRRSGRVPWVRAALGDLLRIKPLVEVHLGEVKRLAQVRTRKRGVARLLEAVQALAPFRRIAVLHTNAADAARDLLSALALPADTPLINVTTVIGTHVGPGGLGFALLQA